MNIINNCSFIIVIIFLVIASGCAINEAGTTNSEDLTLFQHLSRKGNLTMRKSGMETIFTHTTGGSTSMNSHGKPLYVVDGDRIGTSFERASELVPKGNIKSVRVLSPGESSFYGSQGGHGVILIETIGN